MGKTIFAAVAAACVFAGMSFAQNVISARPGLINYTEGEVLLDGRPVQRKPVSPISIGPGQVLETAAGKAEVLLTPGALLRLGDDSAVALVSSDLADAQVELRRGVVMVEITELFKDNKVRIREGDSAVTLLKKGLYRFDAGRQSVSVYDGKARVTSGDREVEIGKGKTASLDEPLETAKFDRKKEKEADPLYRWSEVRSGFLAEANVSSVRAFAENRRPWAGPGWYWDPMFSSFAFVPRSGILYSPFGFEYYSPGMAAFAPVYLYRTYAGGTLIPGRPLPRPRTVRPAISPRDAMSAPLPERGITRGVPSIGRGGTVRSAPAGRTAGGAAGGGARSAPTGRTGRAR